MKPYRIDQVALVSAISKELGRQHPGLPVDNRYNTIIKAANGIVAEYDREPVMATSGMGLEAWLNSDDTGASSLFMAYALCNNRHLMWYGRKAPSNNYPRDVDDLGRCIRLSEAVPEFGERIAKMAYHGPHWAAVANNWAEWVTMYQAGDLDRLDAAMEEAFTKAGAK